MSGGSLELSQKAEVTDGRIIIKPGANATLQLNLDQNKTGPASSTAGFDANKAKVKLPEYLTLKFSTGVGQLTAGDASCKVFGCGAEFTFNNSAPVWLGPLGQILVPYSVKTTGRQTNTFEILSSDSKLCRFKGKAKLKTGSGWLLPAAKVTPAQLGTAAGTGALAIAAFNGITAAWKGLKGGLTKLIQPGIIVEPGMMTVLDFFAANLNGKQRWNLWKNAPAKHHSEITLSFGKAFPFIYISVSKGSEAVVFFCKHKASLDRPVDANGVPFKIESSIALASIVQTGNSFRAFLSTTIYCLTGISATPRHLNGAALLYEMRSSELPGLQFISHRRSGGRPYREGRSRSAVCGLSLSAYAPGSVCGQLYVAAEGSIPKTIRSTANCPGRFREVAGSVGG